MEIKITVLGEPQGKGRPRFSKVGAYVKAYTPAQTISYENLIKLEYRRQSKDFCFEKDVPLDVRILAFYTIPKSTSKKRRAMMEKHLIRPMKKPDADNVVKVVLDSLNKVAFHDDVQVVDCQVRRFYSESPRLVITIKDVSSQSKETVASKEGM